MAKRGERTVDLSLRLTREVVDGVGVGFGLATSSTFDVRLALEFARLLAAVESCNIVNSDSFR